MSEVRKEHMSKEPPPFNFLDPSRCVQAADWPADVAVAAPLIAAAPPLLCMARFVPQASPQLENDE